MATKTSFLSTCVRQAALVAASALCVLAGSARAENFTLVLLGDLAGGEHASRAMSINDASQVAGWSDTDDGHVAFYWDADRGMVNLGSLLEGGKSEAYGINIFGDVVGWSDTPNGDSEATLWRHQNFAAVGLGDLSGGVFNSRARAVNSKGQVVGLGANDLGTEAFVWDRATGMTAIGDLPGGTHNSRARALNNGGVIAGRSDSEFSDSFEAFVFDPLRMCELQGLGDLDEGIFRSTGNAINDIGQVAGIGNVSTGSEAMVWDAENGMIGLGDLPGGFFQSSAYGINEAGEVVGTGRAEDGEQAFIWDPVNGMRQLSDLIIDGSADGLFLRRARDINNKREIVGYLEHPDGTQEAYLLIPVP